MQKFFNLLVTKRLSFLTPLILSLGFALSVSLDALNTHDVSGLQSTVWTMTSDKLPLKNWKLTLETFEYFPFEFEKSNESICFESRDSRVQLSFYTHATSGVSDRGLSCCFVTNAQALKNSPDLVSVQKIVLAPKKNEFRSQAMHFEVTAPKNIFKDFYCSAITDDFDGLSARKTHLPSLAEMSEVLSMGFRLNPDPI